MNRRYGNLCRVIIYRHVPTIKNHPDNPLNVRHITESSYEESIDSSCEASTESSSGE